MRSAFPNGAQIYGGMTMLEYYAAEAMKSFITEYGGKINTCDMAAIAHDSFDMAKAMLTEAERRMKT